MKKWSLVLLLPLTVMVQFIFAKPVGVQTAQTIALNFFKLNSTKANGVAVTPLLKYTHTEANGTVDFYVFDMLPVRGFVIVAADDNLTPVIGYSTETNFNPNVSNIGLSDWIKTTEYKISSAIQQAIPADARILNQWNAYRTGVNPNNSRASAVTPLITTFWNQDPYYNDLCPYNTTHSLRTVTGCVATTMAQIMKYWNYPAKGVGTYTYTCAPPYFSHNYGIQTADFGNTTYNWANMPSTISSTNLSVATLMYHCGVAVAMDYGDMYEGGSGAYVLQADAGTGYPCAQRAYANYFQYDATSMKGVRARNYTAENWIALMKTDLDAGRPIQYQGYDPGGGGHTWVCDGYDVNNMLHMNWGWGGTDNGYFSITSLTAAGYNFSTDESALIGIQPLATAPVANLMANTTNSCNGTVNFYDLSNNYPTSWLWNFGDGTTSTLKNPTHTYTNNGNYTVTLTATNSKGTNTKTSTNYVTVARGTAPTANNVSNCASSTFSIPVSTTNPVAWFDSSGNRISSANPFTTTLLTKTTTFWVEDTIKATTYRVGPATNTIGSGANFASNMRALRFNVKKAGILQSVYVYANTAGYRTIQCMDSLGTIFTKKTVYCPAGGSRVSLDFNLVPGGPYYMGLGDSSNLYRNSTGAAYPYNDANGIVTISGNDGGSTATGYYYYFYDWNVKELDCISQRKPVTALVGALNASISASTPPSCYGQTNGTATVTVGGTGSYVWSNGQTSATATGLGQGTYTVSVNDGSGCSVTLSKTINQPAAITPTATVTNVACNGGNNGAINMAVTGGTGSYTYNWGGGITSQNRTGLAPGTYNVTITDASNCSTTTSRTISQPAVLSLAASTSGATCNGTATGAINLTISGGTSGYTYNWGGGIISQNRTGLAAGAYAVTVTDASGCSTSSTQVVTQPAVISPTGTVTNASCGASTGAINVTVTGGTGAYTYNWGGGIVSQNRTGLASGTYTVTITDAANCTTTMSKTVGQSNTLSSSASATNVNCNGAANGAINLTVSGGNPTYTYNWGAGVTSQNRTGLTAGTYTVTITDASGCTSTVSQTITQPTAVSPTATAANVNCNGATNGTINVSVTGGTGSYTYNWGGGVVSQNRTGLTAGTYTVTITDGAGCATTTSKTITEPTAIVPTTTATNINCNGGNNGSINLAVTGGNPTYSYNWGAGVTSQNRTGLTAGTYTVTITDGSGCTSTASKTITQPTVVSPSSTATNVVCNGDNNGTINVTVTGGTGSYTYNWGAGVTSQNRSGLAAGTYTATITDGNNCTSTTSKTITQPTVVSPTATVTNISCSGGNTGAINLTVTGGTGAYTYNWGGGVISQNRSGLAAGTYTVTITDAVGCTSTLSKTITQSATLTANTTATDISCNGGSNGAINLTVNGGNPGYTYNWGAGVTSQNRTGLTAGTYAVTITDASGCTSTATKTITQPSVIAPTATATNTTCNTGSNGTINVTVTGGTGSYTYNWGAGVTSQNRTGLTAGTYTVTITDGNGCTSTTSRTITQPTAVMPSGVVTHVSCNGGNTGAIDVSVNGGAGNYTYNWGGGITSQDRTGLSAGTYTVTITDAVGCTVSLSKTLSQSGTLNPTATAADLSCYGATNGAINLTVSGGTAGYTYNWGAGVTSQNRTGLAAGTYTVTITDASGCSITASKTIVQPTAVSSTLTSINATCFGTNTGSINLTANGGTPTYSYNWGAGVTSRNRTNLSAGTYTVTITDASGCTATASKTITQPTVVSPTATATNITCNGTNNGAIIVAVSGGNPTYTYNWGAGVTTQNRTGLGAGTYAVTITDASGCTATASKTITQPTAITASAITSNVTCNGGNTGTINLTVSGGAANYTYNWGGGVTTQNRTGLGAGTYTVTITDASNCTTSLTKTITQSNTLATNAVSTNVSCFGGNNGAINISVSGGTAGYTYNWGGGVVSQNRTNLAAGTYTVTITDGSGCITTASKIISQPVAVTPVANATDVACNGGSTGSITLTTTGGNANYTYNWGGGVTSQNRTGLSAGTYNVIVTDANGCTGATSKTITQPAAIAPVATATAISCNGANNGSITIAVTGGNASYTYNWGNNITTQNRTGLSTGTYTVTITDANGCTATTAKTITQPTAIVPTATVSNIICSTGNTGAIDLAVTGGTGAYTYNWGSGITSQSRDSLAAGTYTVTITDANNCTASISKTITQSNSLVATTTATNVKCAGGNDGEIALQVNGGNPTYTYNWGAGITSANRTGLTAGTYSVTITDASGCSATATKTITQPSNGIVATGITTDVSCNGSNSGTINITVTGGTAGYTYNWGGGITSQNRDSLAAGSYTVTITDALGCTGTLSKIVSQNNTIVPVAASTPTTCNGGNNGTISLSVSGGNPGYTYNWGGGITSQNRTGLAAGDYTVTITDASGCVSIVTKTVTQPAGVSATPTATNVKCNGGNTGAITLAVSGGNPSYTFNWGSNIASQNRTGLVAGTYTVTVTDASGCKTTATQTITEATAIAPVTTGTNVSCNGGANGTINLTVTGGSPNYTYNWGAGVTTKNRTGLAAGTYTVTITDGGGCTTTTSKFIAQPTAVTLTASPTHIACNGASTGAITLAASGGTQGYTYNWGGGITTQNRTGLTAGTYNVTFTDGAGCKTTVSQTLTQATAVVVTTSATDLNCNGTSTGIINLTTTGGTPNYTYNWGNNITTQNRTGLAAGSYTVTITDGAGCKTSFSKTIIEPAPLVVSTTKTDATCNLSNGSASAIGSGGTAGYSYTWNNQGSSSSISNVAAGTYTVVITDNNHCTSSATVIIANTSSLETNASVVNNLCTGNAKGTATVNVTSGTQPFTYLWNNGDTTSTRANLRAGEYKVTITDGLHCQKTQTVTLTDPAPMAVNYISTNNTCHGDNSGSATIRVLGGKPGYQFTWSNGDTTSSVSQLPAGNYVVTITDQNKCIAATSVNITEPAAILLSLTAGNNSSEQANGTATVSQVTNAVAPYTFEWSNGDTGTSVSNLLAGTYEVTITDKNGCRQTASVTIGRASGIEDLNNSISFVAYPNPATTGVTVRMTELNKETTISFRNTLGQTLLTNTITNLQTNIDLSAFAAGLYWIELTQGEKRVVKEIIVSK